MSKLIITIPNYAADGQLFANLVAPYLESLGYNEGNNGDFSYMLKKYAEDKVIYNLQEKAREFQHDSRK